MSVTVIQQQEYDCSFADCDGTRTRLSSVRGSFCSEECADRHDGRQFLRSLRQDHSVCWSCLRLRKELERPTDESRRGLGPVVDAALVGYEYLTEHAEYGEFGVECTCGAVDHDIEDYDRRDEGPFHWRMRRLVEATAAEGQHDGTFDLEAFADTLWETDDLELAVGRAIET